MKMMMNMMKMMVRMAKMEMMRMMIEITNLFIHLREQVLFVFKLPKHSLKKHQSISICSTFLQSTVQKVILIFHCNWIQNIKHWISMNFTKAKNLKSRQCYARTRCWNERFLSIRWIRATFVVQSGLLQQKCNMIQAQTKICNTEVFTPVAFIGEKNVPSLLVSS